MQSNTARGARRLLVTAGAMTLGLSAIAPAIVGAETLAAETEDETLKKVWICHETSRDTNSWVLIHTSLNAVGHERHEADVWFRTEAEQNDLREALGLDVLHPSQTSQLHDDSISAACATIADETRAGGGTGGDGGQGGDGAGGDGGDQGGDRTGGDDQSTGGEQGTGGDQSTGGEQGGNGPGSDTVVGGDEVISTPATPATPATPGEPGEPATPAEPARPALPVVISTDAVERPAERPARVEVEDEVQVAPRDDNEVLGVTTTRTPTPAVGASEVAAQTVTGTLPRTGADGTRGLVAAGGALLLAGLALEATSRRRKDAQAGGQLSAS